MCGNFHHSDVGYRLAFLLSRHKQTDFSVLDAAVGLHRGCVAQSLSRHYVLHTHARRDINALVGLSLNHRGVEVVDGSGGFVVYLKRHTTYLVAREHSVAVAVGKAHVADSELAVALDIAVDLLHAACVD